jgi:hypothetical protein
LLIKGSHIRCCVTIRSGKLACERLLPDLGQIAEATRIKTSSTSSVRTPRWGAGGAAHKSTLNIAPSPDTARYTHWTVSSVVAFLSLEEIGRGDKWAREGCDSLETLANVESHCGVAWCAKNGDVRIGSHLETCEATADDKGGTEKTTVLFKFRGWPEKDGACGLSHGTNDKRVSRGAMGKR